MAGSLSLLLGDVLTPVANAYATVRNAKNADKRLQYELDIKTLDYQTARENRAAALASAETTKNLLNSDLVKKMTVWTMTTVAGAMIAIGVSRLMK